MGTEFAPPRRYTIERSTAASLGARSAYRDPPSTPSWLLKQLDRECPALWNHDALVEIGAVAIRWFSAEEWSEGGPGQELPY